MLPTLFHFQALSFPYNTATHLYNLTVNCPLAYCLDVMRVVGSFVALAAEPMEKHRAIPNTIATERAMPLGARSEHLMCSSPLSVLVMSNPFL